MYLGDSELHSLVLGQVAPTPNRLYRGDPEVVPQSFLEDLILPTIGPGGHHLCCSQQLLVEVDGGLSAGHRWTEWQKDGELSRKSAPYQPLQPRLAPVELEGAELAEALVLRTVEVRGAGSQEAVLLAVVHQ